jgi:poly(3-hydroxyalkanoate) synthetase
MSVPILAADPEGGLPGLPDLAEIARTCAAAAERASRILGGFIGKKMKEGVTPGLPRDEEWERHFLFDFMKRSCLISWVNPAARLAHKRFEDYLQEGALTAIDRALADTGEKDLNVVGYCLGGTPIDIGKVKAPCCFVSTLEDHIAPWKSAYKGARLPSGLARFVVGGSGHIAGIVNPPAANKYGCWVNDARPLPEAAEDYLAGATQYSVSWWTDWQAWIGAHPGGKERVVARPPGKRLLKAIEDAPGSYVKLRLEAPE